ncbi:metal cation transporter, ZIP family, partial [Ostertagia ostertagi]
SIEKELRQEAEEISRLLSTPQSIVTPSVCLLTLLGCTLVVLCGVLPALLLPANSSQYLSTDEGRRNLNMLLSFAVGSLLGDVFLHILPATWNENNGGFGRIGMFTMSGLLACLFVEKLCSTTEKSQRKICAIMNLAANLIDNFTHGLAVGASFLISPKFGMMTTFAILVHEIPHEVSDFAILLRADFNRIQAVKAQLVTASGGIIGAFFALWMNNDSMQSADWILPFTAGGFINIALAQILPELNQEKDRRQNVKQVAMMLLGLFVMVAISCLHII